MNVQHITRRFVRESWGGTESAVLALAQQLQAGGHRTDILTSMALAGSIAEDISGVKISRFKHFYPYLGLSQESAEQLDMRAGNLFSLSLLLHMLKSRPADVYHLHTGKRMGGIVRVAARHHRRPYVVSLHGGVLDVPASEREGWTEPTKGTWEWGRFLGAAVGARRVLDDASAILCVNRAEREMLQEKFPGKCVLWCPNTVDVARYRNGCGDRFRAKYGIRKDAKVILNVARIDAQKNQLATLKVFEQVASTTPDLWLLLAGPSTNAEYALKLDRAIESSAHSRNIIRIGNVDAASQSLVDMYHAADVFLLNSLHEPFGIVLLEAWAAGLPIVAPRVGGIPSFVDHGITGLIFESDELKTATKHVQSLLHNNSLADCIRDQALQQVQRFDSTRCFGEVLSLYEEVSSEHSLRA